jgi:succinate-semialdehyde dehydrogenase / glutarate-semialdehyde dehydrogenase
MKFRTLNPLTNTIEQEFECSSQTDLQIILDELNTGFYDWSKLQLRERTRFLVKLAELLLEERDSFARLMAKEMGKPIAQGVAEIKKCSLLCKYYAENSAPLLSEFESDKLRVQPLGVILGIMPWNFPFWQVLRFAIPNLVVGNSVLIKHAPNVPQCALAIKNLFKKAGFADGVFNSVFLSNEQTETLIADPIITGVSLTGSERAGRAVASAAGNSLKPVILELGGSDPFIVCHDANLDEAVKSADTIRCLNAGQTCISAKRFIIHEKLIDSFLQKLAASFDAHNCGDPLELSTTMGPLARLDLKDQLQRQVDESINLGAKLYYKTKLGDDYSDCFYPPTILTNITRDMPVFSEETFGPVAAVIPFSTEAEALAIANDTSYGLGASVWCETKKTAEFFVNGLAAGNVFVNSAVKSSPELPFGGIKNSGFGRELGLQGLIGFVNLKTVITDY